MRKKQKSSMIFRVALVVFCLVLFSAHLTSGLLAKYSVNNTDTISAGVAKMDFSITSAQSAPSIAADGGASYTFAVENTGEVTVGYSLVVSLAPGTVDSDEEDHVFSNVQIDGVAGVYDAVEHTYTFSDLGMFEVGESATHTLTFDTNDFVSVSASVASPVLSYKDIVILISAKTVQID